MRRKIVLFLLALSALGGVHRAYAGQVVPSDDGDMTEDSVGVQTDTVQVSDVPGYRADKDYSRMLFLKVNKGKGYRNHGFEREGAYALLEKGVSYLSFNVNFRGNDAENYWIEPVAIIDKAYNRNIGVNLSGGYLFKDNIAVGGRAGYSFSETNLSLNADLLEIIIDAKDYATNNVKSTFYFGGSIKNFIPLDYGHRFFVTSETYLDFSYTSSLAKNDYDNGNKIHKVEKDKYAINLGITPGVMYFMTAGLAFEFSLSPVVAYYEHSKVKNNHVEKGSTSSYGLNFKFMPFNIQFGFTYFFGLDYHKNREYVANRYNDRR